MVTEALVAVVAAVARFIARLMPSFSAPDWLTVSLPGLLREVGTYVTGVSAWLPIDHAVTVLGFVAGAVAAAVAVRLLRIVASFLTAGGGSAG